MRRCVLLVLALVLGCKEAKESQKAGPKQEETAIQIGVDQAIAATGLHEVLRTGYEAETKKKLVMTIGKTEEIRDLALAGKLDGALLAGEPSFEALKADGVAKKSAVIAHEETVFIGPPEDPARAHGAVNPVDLLRNIATYAALYILPERGTAEAERHRELMTRVGGLEPGSMVRGKRAGVDLVRFTVMKKGYSLVLRSALVMAKRAGVDVSKAYQDGQPDMVLRIRAIEMHPGKTKRPPLDDFVAFCTGDKGKGLISTFGAGTYGLPLYSVGEPEPGQGARVPVPAPPK